MNQVHTFAGEWERQKEQSARWVDWYARHFGVVPVPASRVDDLEGIDFWATGPSGTLGLQLKVDFRSDDTGSFFIEWHIESSGEKRPGWAQTLHADDYWFMQPIAGLAICVGRGAFSEKVDECRRKDYPLLGPVKNVNPVTGETWRAFGMPVGVKAMGRIGTIHKIGGRIFPEGG
jgi:hypothetical protein